MTLSRHLRRIVLLIYAGSLNFLWAEIKLPPFGIESGMILYDIRGGGQLTPETNLSVKGSENLHFKAWGEVTVEEVNSIVVTKGAIQHQESVKRFEKETKDTIITVDFENEQLLERKKSSIKKDLQRIQTKDLEKKGTQKIAGFLCDVWEGDSIKKCIYKGIVLKLESHVYNVTYEKVATKVVFDKNQSEEFEVPDYPLQEFGLFRGNIKTKNISKSEDFYKLIHDVNVDKTENNQSDRVGGLGDPKRKKFINRISREIFEQQQEILPQMLYSMKQMRACLQTVENPFEANQCVENFKSMQSKVGKSGNDYIILWDEKRKNTLLDKVEEDIIDLESRIACVKRAKNMYDLSACMK
ncbi:MAG: hypothetical protein U9O64_07080 [Campylobacterota bacterium]|nr:hypothetical protein [Campylobacterota bacterium]